MSVAIPVAAVVFGSVAPPQGDILELNVHLGCTKEVSSFNCLLQNFEKKYTVTNPINVGDNGSISIGRGSNCPLILTLRVEEVQPESTPVDNYIRVRGRCWGEKIFRRVVTKIYENQKGEAIVRDLIDSYVGLCHVRTNSALTSDAAADQKDCVVANGALFSAGQLVKIEDDSNWEYNEVASVSDNTVTMVNNLAHTYTVAANGKVWIDLIEKTDTTYTLLEYENSPVFDILKYIAESADKSGTIGFDFRVEYDARFAFFPKNSKTSSVSLSDAIERSQYSKDISRVRNKIRVYGAPERPYPLDVDGQLWSDSLTEDLTKPNNQLDHADGPWTVETGNTTIDIETTIVHTGSKSIKVSATAYMYWMLPVWTFDTGKELNANQYPEMSMTLREDGEHEKTVVIRLEDSDGKQVHQVVNITDYDTWETFALGIGRRNEGAWTFNQATFDWEHIKKVKFQINQNYNRWGNAYIDRFYFGKRRWEVTEENATSQSSYGLRELVEVDEELHSNNECSLRGKALIDHLSTPSETLTVTSTILDFGTDHLLAGDKTHATIANDDIDADFRIAFIDIDVRAAVQDLTITMELGREKPLLADYIYGLRATTVTVEKLMRTKTSYMGGGGSGGGGGGLTSHTVGSHSDVTISSPVDKQALVYEDASSQWKNKTQVVYTTLTMGVSGTLTTGTNKALEILAPCALTIVKVKVVVKTAPTGSSIIIDVNKDGTTIFTTQGNRPEIAIDGKEADSGTPDVTSLSEGDNVTFDIDQVGSGTAGAELTVHVVCKQTVSV